jgi:hypothetical protein
MSSAVIESPMISDDCFSCWLLFRLCLMLVTMTSSTVWSSVLAGGLRHRRRADDHGAERQDRGAVLQIVGE